MLTSTDRLGHCVDEKGENLFFKFTYLAVIVDDAYLEIPSVLDGDDDLIRDSHVYKSFFPSNDKEIEEWQEWLKKSIHKVFLFLKILKISWEHYEVKKLSRALKEYKPTFEDIHNKNCEEIKDIAISLNLKDIDSFY